MSKQNRTNLKVLTAGAMMAALSIILERLLPITPPSNMIDIRISLSNVPIILASILISPLAGGLAGVVSDIVGCFLSGYAPFPILTLAPLVMGVLPGLLLCREKKMRLVKLSVVLVLTHIISSIVITTYGLSVMRGVAFVPMLITRLPSCSINLVIDVILVCLLIKTPLIKKI